MKLKETPEDLAVKERLWLSCKAEAMRLGARFAEAHVVGERYSEAQRDVIAAAKTKLYPAWLIRELAMAERGGEFSGRADVALKRFRGQIEL